MSDNVERHKSTRWVKGVPTYGDWGDDEDDSYGYDYNDDDVGDEATHRNKPYDGDQTSGAVTHDLTTDHQTLTSAPMPALPQNIQDKYKDIISDAKRDHKNDDNVGDKLVLSIDHNNDDLSSNSSDDDEKANPVSFQDSRNYQNSGHEHLNEAQQPFLNRTKAISLEEVPHTYEEAVPGAFRSEYKQDSKFDQNNSGDGDDLQNSIEKKKVDGANSTSKATSQYDVYAEDEEINDEKADVEPSQYPYQYKQQYQTQQHYQDQNTPIMDNSRRNDFFVPPTPTYSEFSTHSGHTEPASEASFQSDTSIQAEPHDLNIGKTHYREHNDEKSVLESHKLHVQQTNSPEINGTTDKLVLSIDNKRDEVDSDSTDDDWGYNGPESDDDDDNDDEDDDDDEERKRQTYSEKNKDETTEPDIDTMISELSANTSDINSTLKQQQQQQQKQQQQQDQEILPNLRTSLQHDDENVAYHYEEFESPIAPLSTLLQHNEYLSGFAERKGSVRKPPARDEKEVGNDNIEKKRDEKM
ncbi:predicted protein [Lodderomyces elongisporus NRRL YB-4239]|uniref:Uncharacterized protein n=1 Tax=Lodderomyces elongisporus (strain ATCC 11503 / CBS 2605 / JCM 1781 / NBRC 1676 / NRRL YB-4239) TaxID=379508 RepID=A5E3Q5_LODEL|nr:predicted protein [Lodderomyces elongisporus NRRL YB-4239]